MADKLSFEQFGAKIKAKHPEYADMPDGELGRKVYAKYPEYQDMVDPKAASFNKEAALANINSPAGGLDYQPFQKTSAVQTGLGILKKLGGYAGGVADMIGSAMQNPSVAGVNMAASTGQGIKAGADATPQNAGIPEKVAMRIGPALGIDTPALAKAAANRDVGGMIVEGGTPAGVAALTGPAMRRVNATKIPSMARASEAFGEVAKEANPVQVDITNASSRALEAADLANSGGTMPKVIRDFMRRATDPNKPPITYEEARKFYSNATRVSADEANRLTKPMKRQLGMFTEELGKSIQEAADSAGVGDQYAGAMQEYRNAAKLQAIKSALMKGTKRALIPTSLGALGAYEYLKR